MNHAMDPTSMLLLPLLLTNYLMKLRSAFMALRLLKEPELPIKSASMLTTRTVYLSLNGF